jgi:hypothetical protein
MKAVKWLARTILKQNDRDFMELIQLFRTMFPRYGSRLTIRISSDILNKNKAAEWRVCFAGRRRVTMWWRTRQTDLGARRSSTLTRILARRPSLRPARPHTRPFPFARTQAAVSALVEPLAQAQDPIPTARRGPHAAPITLDPTNHPTAPPRQAGCRMAPPTATSLTACKTPTIAPLFQQTLHCNLRKYVTQMLYT